MEEKNLSRLAGELLSLCREKGLSLCTAESCTGGMIAETITALSGASEVFLGALVTYDEHMKARWLSVSEETLQKQGAVSAACAVEMAEGARLASGADLALSVTGFAGPSGGTEQDPVGTVYFGVSTAQGTKSVRHAFSGDREAVRRSASDSALRLLLEAATKQTV